MKTKEGGRRKFGGAGRKEDGNCRQTLKIQRLNFCKEIHTYLLQVCRVGKMLKERILVVCCLCYARGEHPERKSSEDGKSHH